MGMTSEQNTERVRAISNAYRGRAEAVRAGADREKEREKAEKKAANKRRVEADETPEEEVEDGYGADEAPDQPKESWKKDDIIDWLLDNGVEAERSDLEELTKAELIENFVDDEG